MLGESIPSGPTTTASHSGSFVRSQNTAGHWHPINPSNTHGGVARNLTSGHQAPRTTPKDRILVVPTPPWSRKQAGKPRESWGWGKKLSPSEASSAPRTADNSVVWWDATGGARCFITGSPPRSELFSARESSEGEEAGSGRDHESNSRPRTGSTARAGGGGGCEFGGCRIGISENGWKEGGWQGWGRDDEEFRKATCCCFWPSSRGEEEISRRLPPRRARPPRRSRSRTRAETGAATGGFGGFSSLLLPVPFGTHQIFKNPASRIWM
jgi:hypothetical protein